MALAPAIEASDAGLELRPGTIGVMVGDVGGGLRRSGCGGRGGRQVVIGLL